MNPSKRKAFSVDDKLAIIKTYDAEKNVKTQKAIAEELGIPGSTLRTILAKRDKTSEVVGGVKRQKVRSGKFEKLEAILLEWFHQARAANLPVSGPILKAKAAEVAERLSIEDFGGSGGWLDRF